MVALQRKRGISLLVLLITIIIMLILTTVIIVWSDDSRENAIKASYIKNLTTIQDSVKSYYLLNNSYPIPNIEELKVSFSLTDIQNLNDDEALLNEVNLNNDETSIFYLIDLSLLDITSIGYGNKYNEQGSLDVFLVSSDNFNVYYLKGIEIKDTVYYSLSKNLTYNEVSKESNPYSSGENDIYATSTGKISLLNLRNGSSLSELKVMIQLSELESVEVETLNYIYSPEATTGVNIFKIAELLSDDQIDDINQSDEITVRIKKEQKVIEERKVTIPDFTGENVAISNDDVLLFNNDGTNTIIFDVDSSNVNSKVRYEYLNVFNTDSSVGYVKYIPSLDTDEKMYNYVKDSGKIANIGYGGKCVITLPKKVRDIFVVIENAVGNYSYTSKSLYPFYAKANLLNYSNGTAKININTVAPQGTNLKFSYSQNGVNYSNYTEDTADSVVDSKLFYADDINLKNVYVKSSLEIKGKEYEFVDKILIASSNDVDRSAPTLTNLSVTSPSSGSYSIGQQINIVATYDESVYNSSKAPISSSLSSAPVLKIKFDAGSDITLEASSSERNTITYTYTITSGDSGKLKLASYTGTIYDLVGNSRNITANYLAGYTIIAGSKLEGLVSYSQKNIGKLTTDSAFTNPLTKTGDGTVTYTSSNTSVATVNSSSRRSDNSRCRRSSNNCNSRR